MNVWPRILCLLLLFTHVAVQAQVRLVFADSLPPSLKKSALSIPSDISQSTWQNYARQLQLEAYGLGYFLYESKWLQQSDSSAIIELSAGKQFEAIELLQNDKKYRIKAKEFQRLVADSLSHYTNTGHPFVKIVLKAVSAEHPQFTLVIEIGPAITIGRLVIKPEGIIQAKVLSQLVQLQAGEVFSIAQLEQIKNRLANQSGFKMIRDPEWLVQDGTADIFLYLERVKASTATGILGLQPNPSTQKNTLVGELQVSLQNTWQKNEKLYLNWRSIAPQVQMLQLQLNWPYIASSAYGLQSALKMYKRDSSFIELKSQLGVQYQLPQAWQLIALFDFWRSSQLSVQQNAQVASFRNLSYGISLQRRTLNNLYNPSKGQLFQSQFLVGTKKVTQAHLTWRFELQQQQFFQLANRHTLLFQQQLGHIASDSLFKNELYRFGGLDRMRGFNEETFFASSYAVTGLEYRFLLDQYAYASLFTDWAAFVNPTMSTAVQIVEAFGVGFAIGSEKGLFKLNYALGSYFGAPLQLSAGKIHLAYISYF
ncbi:MAG: BamA/TamA family outer membrane protein [Flavobacteriales bacterium]